MNCRELINEFLMEYVEGKLPAKVTVEFDRHLAVCPACVAFVDGYRRTTELSRQALGATGPVTKPSDEKVPEELVNTILKLRPKG